MCIMLAEEGSNAEMHIKNKIKIIGGDDKKQSVLV